MKNQFFGIICAAISALPCSSAQSATFTFVGNGDVDATDLVLFHKSSAAGTSDDLSSMWEGGLVPTDAVTNATAGAAADIVLEGTNDRRFKNYRMVFVTAGAASSPFNVGKLTDWYFKSISGSRTLRLEFPCMEYSYKYGQKFHIEDPSGFHGLWWHTPRPFKGPYRQFMHVTSSDPSKAVIHRVLAQGRMGFGTDAGKTLKIENLIGMGAFEVNSAASGMSGTVDIEQSPGGRSDATVYQGRLVLHGNPDPSAGLCGVPWLHLDASVESSFTLSGDEVTQWRDVRGNGIYAYTDTDRARGNPRRVDDTASGMKVVTFGAFRGEMVNGKLQDPFPADLDNFGAPSGQRLNMANHNVKEMFVVFKYNQFTNAWPALFGAHQSYAGIANNAKNRFQPNNSFNNALFKDDTEKLPTGYDERSAQNLPLNYSEIRLDGQRVPPAYRDDFTHSFHVLSVGLADGVSSSVNAICDVQDAIWRPHVGGAQIAEAILYTNSLTCAQRRQINNYLRAKWLKDDADYDLGAVELREGATLEVADGTAHIRELQLPAGTTSYVKTGAGTLVLDRISVGGVVTNLPVAVEAGDFRFGDAGSISAEKAADPEVWFDATQIAAADTTTIDGNDYVTVWRDPRGRNRKGVENTAERWKPSSASGYAAYAKIIRGGQNGKDVVSFGAKASLTAATFAWDTSGKDAAPYAILRNGASAASFNDNDTDLYAREGFLVCRVPASAGAAAIWASISSYHYDFFNSNSRKMYSPGYGNSNVDGARWQMDGQPFSAYTETDMPAGRFVVVSFAAAAHLPVTAFAVDRGTAASVGGIDVAEMLLYDRVLSETERRNTTAYLIEKWFAKEHPEQAVISHANVSMSDAGAEITAHADGTLESIPAVSGTLVKTGTGDVAANDALNLVGFSAIDVREGMLSGKIGASNVMERAQFHVDAEASTMTITNDVPGGTDFVTVWNDVRGNGLAAYAYNDAKITGGISPALKTFTVGGKSRRAVDFGIRRSSAASDGAAMRWFSPSSGQSSQNKLYSEFYTVSADQTTGGRGDLFGNANWVDNTVTVDGTSTTTVYPFYRNGKSAIIDASAKVSWATVNGEIYVDNESESYIYAPAAGAFHSYAFVPAYPARAGAFAARNAYEWGGTITAEAMVFETTNSVAARAMLRGFLQKKWFGSGAGYTPSFESISVARGASLEIASDAGVEQWSVATLAGGGMIDTGHGIKDVSRVEIGYSEADGFDCLTVEGPVALADGAVISLSLPSTPIPKELFGDHLVLAASPVAGTATLLLENGKPRMSGTIRLSKQADGYHLVLAKAGFVMTVK